MSRLRTLLLSGPAPPDTVAVWFGDLPLDARLECCYGPPNDPRAMGLWFPKLGADAKLQIIVGPAPAGPCMGIWRGTVLDWPGSVFMVGAPPKPGFRGCWVRPGPGMAELEACLVCPRAGTPASGFAAAAPALACGANAGVLTSGSAQAGGSVAGLRVRAGPLLVRFWIEMLKGQFTLFITPKRYPIFPRVADGTGLLVHIIHSRTAFASRGRQMRKNPPKASRPSADGSGIGRAVA